MLQSTTNPTYRRRPLLWASAFVLVALLSTLTGPAGGASTIRVWFLQGDRWREVRRLAAEGVAVDRFGEQGAEVAPFRRSLDPLARQWLTFDPAKARVLG